MTVTSESVGMKKLFAMLFAKGPHTPHSRMSVVSPTGCLPDLNTGHCLADNINPSKLRSGKRDRATVAALRQERLRQAETS